VRAPFIGPAALAAINRERDKRPERAAAMLERAAAPDGASACERHLFCSRVCPQAVYPGKHIQLLKNALAARP
jgi:succinate dehydrogenase / fumarate reductase iron-sulfur subunit